MSGDQSGIDSNVSDPATSQPLCKAEHGARETVSAFQALICSSFLGWKEIPRELGEWTSWLGKMRLPRKERREGPGKLGVVSLKEET